MASGVEVVGVPRQERPLEPGGGVLLRFASDLRALRSKAGGLTYRELAQRAHYSAGTLSDAASGRKLPTLAVTLAYVRACGGKPDEWEQRWHDLAAELAAGEVGPNGQVPSGDAGPLPYVGLHYFRTEDAGRFFGRDQLVADLVTRIAGRRFLGVFGPSGAGKSSILRAGLVPRLHGSAPGERRSRETVLFSPGPRPLEECAVQFAGLVGTTAGQLLPELLADPRNLHRIVRQALARRSDDVELVVVVDQFEEVFTLCGDADERDAFVTALLTAATADASRTRIVLGVRADFYPHCADYPDLAEALADGQVLVGPMTSAELRDVIIQPARQAECTVEGVLVSELVAEARGQAAALPLLSHVLLETWRRRRGNTLTLAGYHAAGGIQGALARTAEQRFAAFTSAQQQQARHLFLRLTALGEGTEDTKRRVTRAEIDSSDPDTGEVLEALAVARLITLDENGVEIAHESLIKAWPRLRGWLAEDRDKLRVHRQLTEATRVWEDLGRDPGSLYRGTRLALARERLTDAALSPGESAFLSASGQLEDRERRAAVRRQRLVRYTAAVLAVLLVLAVGAGVDAMQQRERAEQAGQMAISRQLATQALGLAESRPDTAKLLSVEAFRAMPTTEARSALLSLSARMAHQAELDGHEDAIAEVAIAPAGDIMALASKDKTVTLWDLGRRTRLAVLTQHATWLRTVAISQDGRMLATGGDDGRIVLWDVASRKPVATLPGHPGRVRELEFSPDNVTLASGGDDNKTILWNLRSRAPERVLAGHTAVVRAVEFSPDGRTVATGGLDRTVALWDRASGRRLTVFTGHTDRINDLSYAPNDHVLASASTDGTVRLWDTSTRTALGTMRDGASSALAVDFAPDGRTLAAAHENVVLVWDTDRHTVRGRLTGHTDAAYAVAFHPTLPLLVSAGEDGTAILWDPARLPLAGHADVVNAVAFSPDGRTLASASKDGTVVLWDLTHQLPLARLPHHGPVNAVAFSPDARTVATGSGSPTHSTGRVDHAVTLWDVTDTTNPVQTATLPGHTERVRSIDFSPDGRLLATGSNDRTVTLWDVRDHTRLATLRHDYTVADVAFSPDGRVLATAGHGYTAALWSATSHERLATLSHNGMLTAVAFSPDGSLLATASIDRTATLWNVRDRTRRATLTHAETLNSVAFSPDGRTIAVGGKENTVGLWDTATGTRLATLTGHEGPVLGVAFDPAGSTLATASMDQTVHLWNTSPTRTITDICNTLNRDLNQQEWTQFLSTIPYHETCA